MRKLTHYEDGEAEDVVIQHADEKVEQVERAAAIAERRLKLVEARANIYSRSHPS